MIRIEIDDFLCSVDINSTKKYYAAHSVCDCPDCRNLYPQIEQFNPKLTEFLTEFGIDICRPDEAASIERDEDIDYLFIGYSVAGKMHSTGNFDTNIDNLHITITKGDNPFDWFPNEQTGDYFLISVSGIILPWILDEPFPYAKSTPLLKRLTDKFKQFFIK